MRTEQDVLKDFEKLGYNEINKNKSRLRLSKFNKEKNKYQCTIYINYESKHYCKEVGYDTLYNEFIFIQEHKLLNELFQIWGWF